MIIQGIVQRITYHNTYNGFSVLVVEAEEDDFTAVGYTMQIQVGEEVRLEGEWGFHHAYGEQFQFSHMEQILPTSKEGVEAYLASGLIPGIGATMAKRIVQAFGEDTLEVLETAPHRLKEVRGIGEKTYVKIEEALAEHHRLRRVLMTLNGWGIATSMATRLYRYYGDETVAILQENPYRMAEDVPRIGFKTADEIAKGMGVDPKSPKRYRAGLHYALYQAVERDGHCYLPKEEWMHAGAELLDVPVEELEAVFDEFRFDERISIKKHGDTLCCFPSVYHQAENRVAKKLVELSRMALKEPWIALEDALAEIEETQDISFAPEQRECILECYSHGIYVITGGPGTGKTTTLKAVLDLAHRLDLAVVLAAPTGRAAKRMTEATGHPASTVHRLLEYAPSGAQMNFARDEGNPLEADLIIVDEASMLDILLMDSLLKALRPGTRLVLVGDVDQLPSVGAGLVLQDILASEAIPHKRLKHIFRQAEESLIVSNAHRINAGEMPLEGSFDGDYFFLEAKDQEALVHTVVDLVQRRLPAYYGVDPIQDIQVLSPMRKTEAGVNRLNQLLQQALNPPREGVAYTSLGDRTFRVGDKVMALKNNYQKEWTTPDAILHGETEGAGVFNGDLGTIVAMDVEGETMKILMDDGRYVDYDFQEKDEITLAYATTIHKSQGSEFPVVVMPIAYGPPLLMTRNLLYTGLTRAKKLVVLVGYRGALQKMVENAHVSPRYTLLQEKIHEYENVVIP